MSLPNINNDASLALILQRWQTILNPIVDAPTSKPSILKSVSLASGSNTINHLLGRSLQGWAIVRQRAAATVYDTQDANPTPALTLNLTASAPVVVDLLVF
jgi:hypothetical protein